jgi:hypothetical protein
VWARQTGTTATGSPATWTSPVAAAAAMALVTTALSLLVALVSVLLV